MSEACVKAATFEKTGTILDVCVSKIKQGGQVRTINLYQDNTPMERGYLTTMIGGERQSIELGTFIWIGRDPEAPVPVTDQFASLRHARIERGETGYIIRDLRSRNGTFLNGCKINEAPLHDRDRIRVGVTEFVFSSNKDQDLNPIFLTSKNQIWNEELQRLPAMAQSPYPILILGPSGSGKEVIAGLVHKFSSRNQGPFFSVNCSALTETLAESELFGHKRGSFTGAHTERKGAFEAARGGTLFLDEIGDLPLSIQPKLLRALENNEIKAVGADATISTDVRIVAATNHNLLQRVAEGKFREDLYFRLHILQIRPPALNERPEDLDDLITFFSAQNAVRFNTDALFEFHKHDWPGNVRELKNVITRVAALFPGQNISPDMLKGLLERKPDLTPTVTVDEPPVRSLCDVERGLIVSRLKLFGGNQRRVSFELNMPKSTLHDRLKKYGIRAKDYKYMRPKPEATAEGQAEKPQEPL